YYIPSLTHHHIDTFADWKRNSCSRKLTTKNIISNIVPKEIYKETQRYIHVRDRGMR
ncbi:hypothetical protein ACJX0J_019474, partial [Zea mays]